MHRLGTALLAVAGVIHLLPVYGVVGAAQLTQLYGIAFDDPSLVVMMRHRAVLFGIVGGLLLVAAARPALRPVAIVVGLISALSFVAITALVAADGAAVGGLSTVVALDLVAVVALVGAAVLARTAPHAGATRNR